jgi:hypothetical protein
MKVNDESERGDLDGDGPRGRPELTPRRIAIETHIGKPAAERPHPLKRDTPIGVTSAA